MKLAPVSSRSVDLLRLNQRHREDIRDIAHGVEESCVGVCTRYLIDRAAAPAADPEDVMHDVERFVDRYGVLAHPEVLTWRRRLVRARRTFVAMEEQGLRDYVAILHIAYGPEDPVTRSYPESVRSFWGRELAGLARYTDIVEQIRRRLVQQEMWRAQSTTQMKSRLSHAERVITSGDAVRYALSAFTEQRPIHRIGEPKPEFIARRDAYEKRAVAHAEMRLQFLEDTKAEADAMLTEASKSYHAHWLAVGPT